VRDDGESFAGIVAQDLGSPWILCLKAACVRKYDFQGLDIFYWLRDAGLMMSLGAS
jgi:hypothetical protein